MQFLTQKQHGGVAVQRWTCDQEVAGSMPGRAPSGDNSGQVAAPRNIEEEEEEEEYEQVMPRSIRAAISLVRGAAENNFRKKEEHRSALRGCWG